MLVLSRKVGEDIRIGTDTVVVIKSVSRNQVRVAIEAPQSTRILRGELVHVMNKPGLARNRTGV